MYDLKYKVNKNCVVFVQRLIGEKLAALAYI